MMSVVMPLLTAWQIVTPSECFAGSQYLAEAHVLIRHNEKGSGSAGWIVGQGRAVHRVGQHRARRDEASQPEPSPRQPVNQYDLQGFEQWGEHDPHDHEVSDIAVGSRYLLVQGAFGETLKQGNQNGRHLDDEAELHRCQEPVGTGSSEPERALVQPRHSLTKLADWRRGCDWFSPVAVTCVDHGSSHVKTAMSRTAMPLFMPWDTATPANARLGPSALWKLTY